MSKLISVILTGGKSSRMGYENKSFLKIKDKSFIEILIESLKEKSDEIIINANRDISNYENFGYKVVSDKFDGYKGPLAGLHSAIDLYKNSKEDLWFALFPTDAPIINTGIIDNFISITEKKNKVYICKINNIIEPMFSFWSSKIFVNLNEVLLKNNGYKIMKFAEENGYNFINFQKKKKIEFFNVNDKDDYTKLLGFNEIE